MTLEGTFTFNGPQVVVWELLQDPAVLARTLPGTERLEASGPDAYQGVMKVSVGPVSAAKFNVSIVLADKMAPSRFAMQIDAKGALGHTRGTAAIELTAADQTHTLMRYTSNVQVGGTIAAVGQRMLESVSKAMMKQALESLNQELQRRLSERQGNA